MISNGDDLGLFVVCLVGLLTVGALVYWVSSDHAYYHFHPVARLLDDATMQGIKISTESTMFRVRDLDARQLRREIDVIRHERGIRYLNSLDRWRWVRARRGATR